MQWSKMETLLDTFKEDFCINFSTRLYSASLFSQAANKFKLTKKQKFSGRVFYNHQYGVLNASTGDLDVKISDKLNAYTALFVSDNIEPAVGLREDLAIED